MNSYTYIDRDMMAITQIGAKTPNRDLSAALLIGILGTIIGYITTWIALWHIVPTQTTAINFISDLINSKFAFLNMNENLAIRSGTSLLLSTIIGFLSFIQYYKPHLRQNQYLNSKDAIKKAKELAKQEIENNAKGVPLSQDINFSINQETKHTLIIGDSGAGKTTIINHILNGIFQRNDRVLIIDWNGDLIQTYKCKIFNPLDRRSMRWLVALDVVSPLDAQIFAKQIIPDPVDNVDKFITNSARTILINAIKYLQTTKPKCWTFNDLYKTVCSLSECPQTSINTTSILEQMNNVQMLAEAEIDNPNAIDFSIYRWIIGHGPKQIIIGGRTEYEQFCISIMRAVITNASIQLQALPNSNTRKVWFIIDEFTKLGKCNTIQNLLEFGRSRGIRIILSSRNLAQIKHLYSNETIKKMLNLIGTFLIGQTTSKETIEILLKHVIINTLDIKKNITILQTELGFRGDHIRALLVGLGNYILNLPWYFVTPKKYRNSIEWRESFKEIRK